MMRQEEVLRRLHESTAHKAQQEAWEADLKAFEQLKADQEDELRSFRGGGYQQATMYAAFHGVILAAVSQSTLLTCALWWCPASLFSAAYMGALLAIAHKLKSIADLEQDIRETSLIISALIECLDLMQQRGADLDLETVQPQLDSSRPSFAGWRVFLSRNGLSALLFITFFSVVFAWFSIHALCEHCPSCHT